MNLFSKIKWNFRRKTNFSYKTKSIYSIPKNLEQNQFDIKNSIKNEKLHKFITYYINTSLKIIFKICIFSFCLKIILLYIRNYHKVYLRDLSYMQFYGYARRSDYDKFISAKDSIEFTIFPNSFFHSIKYNEKNAVDSFLKVFNKYINHPDFGMELGKFILELLKYQPLKQPKNDPISIILSEYIDSEDFMGSLIRLLKIWFTNEQFKQMVLNKIIDAIFSDKVKFALLDVLIYESLILSELPELKEIKVDFLDYFSKAENKKDTILSLADPLKVIEAYKKVKKERIFYLESPPLKNHFSLTKYNQYLLKIFYDMIHEDDHLPIFDFYYTEHPLFRKSPSIVELHGDE